MRVGSSPSPAVAALERLQANRSAGSDKDKDPHQGGDNSGKHEEGFTEDQITEALVEESLAEFAKLDACEKNHLLVRIVQGDKIPGRRIVEVLDPQGKVLRRLSVVDMVNMLKRTDAKSSRGRLLNYKA